MKKGILGGTFDPIHYGHLLLGESALHELHLDRVIFMPAGIPPFKQVRSGGASDADRMEMVRLAIQGNEGFALSSYEMEKEGVSYTYLTLEALRELEPETEWFFIMGADSLHDLAAWREPARITAAAELVCAVREGQDIESLKRLAESLTERYGARISLLAMPRTDISSTELRSRIREGRSVRYFLPEDVRHYIEDHGIYRNT